MTTADDKALRIARAMFAAEGSGPAWGIELIDVRIDYARIAMRLTPAMMNAHRTVHGGMTFALADSALAYASNARNVRAVVSHASMVFLTPAYEGERLIAEAHLRLREGRSSIFAISITAEDGRAVGEFQGHTRDVGGYILDE